MRSSRLAHLAVVSALALRAAPAVANERPTTIAVETFATLPPDVRFPEGIAIDRATGDLFVGTFDFGPQTNKLVRLGRDGRVEAIRDFGGTPLLGLDFAAGHVYVLNFGASSLERLPADFDATTPVETVARFPTIGSPGSRTESNPDGSQDTVTFGSSGFPGPNAMVFDGAGNLYVSDSFQGAIYRIASAASCATPCAVEVVSHDPLLATAGTPPFGANGLALGPDGRTLYVANTGDHRVLTLDLGVTPPAISIFSISLPGADGLLLEGGRLWVAANQADQVVALDARGRPVARAGSFEGIRADGSPRGLLFPASLVAADGFMYVTNLALPLTPKVGDEPEEDVTRWTVSRFRLRP
jgi:DNA-binding beta-propeller fold protein YncE